MHEIPDVETRIEGPAAHRLEGRAGHLGVKFELQQRKAVHGAAGKLPQAYEFRSADGADAQPAGDFALQRLGRVSQFLGRGEHLRRLLQQARSCARQRHAARAALEQAHLQLFLQRLDLGADRWLADMQPVRSARQVAGLGHRGECLQLIELHSLLRLTQVLTDLAKISSLFWSPDFGKLELLTSQNREMMKSKIEEACLVPACPAQGWSIYPRQ